MIVQAQISDLPLLAAGAREFYQSSAMLGEFHLDKFVHFWTNLLIAGSGVIFLLMNDGKIHGAIGGVTHRSPYSDEQVAPELFWFVMKENRGGGLQLYRRFEQWAREKGCQEIRMVHLADSMPEKVADFYCRVGFTKVETLYAKRLTTEQMRQAG